MSAPPKRGTPPAPPPLDPDAAAALAGITPAELVDLAAEGLVDGALLRRDGWVFRRTGIMALRRHLREKRARLTQWRSEL